MTSVFQVSFGLFGEVVEWLFGVADDTSMA